MQLGFCVLCRILQWKDLVMYYAGLIHSYLCICPVLSWTWLAERWIDLLLSLLLILLSILLLLLLLYQYQLSGYSCKYIHALAVGSRLIIPLVRADFSTTVDDGEGVHDVRAERGINVLGEVVLGRGAVLWPVGVVADAVLRQGSCQTLQ